MRKQFFIKRNIFLEAKRLSTQSELRRIMSYLPNVILKSTGTETTFKIILDEEGSFLIAIFGMETISMEFNSISADLLSMRSIMRIVLSLLAYVNEVYEIKLSQLYGLLLESLIKQETGNEIRLMKNNESEFYSELRNNNIKLSEMALGIAVKNKQLNEALSRYLKLTASLAKTYWKNMDSIREFCTSTGISEDAIVWYIQNSKVFGVETNRK